jgi:hypothetical protein
VALKKGGLKGALAILAREPLMPPGIFLYTLCLDLGGARCRVVLHRGLCT